MNETGHLLWPYWCLAQLSSKSLYPEMMETDADSQTNNRLSSESLTEDGEKRMGEPTGSRTHGKAHIINLPEIKGSQRD